jgi:urea transport system permease protein
VTRIVSILRAAIVAWALALIGAAAQAADLPTLVDALGQGSFADREKAIEALAATDDERVAPILQALGDGELYTRKSDDAVFIVRKQGANLALFDPVSNGQVATAAAGEIERVKVNNRLRRAIEAALGSLTLMAPESRVRRDAAEAVFKSRDPNAIAALDQALAVEADGGVKAVMHQARAAALLGTDASDDDKLAAIAMRCNCSRPSRTLRPAQSRRPRSPASARSSRVSPCGKPARTSGTASRSARCCCWLPSVSPSPSA